MALARSRHVPATRARFALVAGLAACGGRTGLPVDGVTPPREDSSAGPPVYESLPPIDASSEAAAVPEGCADAGTTLVYVLSADNGLYSFDPPSLTFAPIGRVACSAGNSTPFSMAVDRQGIAYSVFQPSGALFRLDTATAACNATPYAPNQLGFGVFGMGYVAQPSAGGERLYVADDEFGRVSNGLAWIDTSTFVLNFVSGFSLPIEQGELTGTADGRLFVFFPDQAGRGSHIAQVDPSTATLLAQNDLPNTTGSAYAFAYWGGQFWVFTSYGGPSTVTRFTPGTGAEDAVAIAPGQIVGAGVSTCAPL